MVQSMKVNGHKIKLTVQGSLLTLMEMFMMENGKMIRLTGKERFFTVMEENILVNGKMIYSMEWELKIGKI